MVMTIALTKGKTATVDVEDYLLVSQYNWYYHKSGSSEYARSGRLFMHNLLMHPLDGLQVDHKDGNGLNNIRSNLRLATRNQNAHNEGLRKNNSSGYKGVCYEPNRDKWRAQIYVEGKPIFLGRFTTPEGAALAYNEASVIHHGEFGYRNEVVTL